MGDGVFLGSVQRGYLKDERLYEFSSEFSVEESHGRFVVENKNTS
jgi:hypothetical protein